MVTFCGFFLLLFVPNVILFRKYKRGIQLDILQVILGGCNVSDSETLSRWYQTEQVFLSTL